MYCMLYFAYISPLAGRKGGHVEDSIFRACKSAKFAFQ